MVLIAYLGEPLKCQLKCHSCAKLALHYSSNNSKGFVWCTILMSGNFNVREMITLENLIYIFSENLNGRR